MRFIRREVCSGINVADVLRAVQMARTALERGFPAVLDCTPRELIESIRMERVRAFLAETEATVAEVAECTGYTHSEYMSVAFKRATGETNPTRMASETPSLPHWPKLNYRCLLNSPK